MSPQSEETKIALMQSRVENLDASVTKILDNHLPHIQIDIKEVKDSITELRLLLAKYVGGAVVLIAIIEAALKFYK